MERQAEDPDSNDNSVPWSGSDGSQKLCDSGSLAGSYDEDDLSDEFPLDPQSPNIPKSDPKSCRPQECKYAGEQQPLPELSGSEEDVSYHEEDNVYLSESRESITESPYDQTSPASLSPHQECPDSEPGTDQISQKHSQSSSSSLGCAADMHLALTLTTEDPQGASNRQDPGTGNRRVESSEEGGSSEAPPASVFFEISDERAEQAEKWNSESDTDLCRPDRHRARCTRLSYESQSEREVKETKSKCKRIARLLTDAPDPQNKGALLFKRRRQRVKKYTLVSYGTGEKLDSEDHIEQETEEVRSAGYNFVATSDSELEEDYSIYHEQRNASLNWGSVGEMEALPETKGKGVFMFTQRRKRMDDIASQQEEMRSRGLPVEALTESECTEAQNIYNTKANYMDASNKQYEYQENMQQMNHLAYVPKPLVPNRTAKPFLGIQDGTNAIVRAGGIVSVTGKKQPRFKASVPINTNPHVWSPSGDIIASRHERISVPAIKSGTLPESKRKTTMKSHAQVSNPQSKGERRSYIESEEDFFSLGAEACNFMQARTVKLKNPPPVAPKPTINPACPPWLSRSPSGEPYIPPRSPVSQPSHGPGGHHAQHYSQQQDWAHPQQMVNRWTSEQAQATLPTPANAWVPINPSSQLHRQPTANSWNQPPPRSPVSMQAHSPSYRPHHLPSPSRNKPESISYSVASCPPQAGKQYVQASKAPQASPKGPVSDRSSYCAGNGPNVAGKGAQLFAKRQSRMQKFVVDADTVQANKSRPDSPTSSLPNYWRYSSNVRAPPPLSYNPLLAPFYPPSAAKQPPSTSPQTKPKTKEKPKVAPKPLNALDIMKHQPYQLSSSLFKYNAVPEAKGPSPKPTPASKFEVTKRLKHRSVSSDSPYNASEYAARAEAEAPAKCPGWVSSPNSSAHPSTRSAEPLATGKHLDEKHAVTSAAHHLTDKRAPSARPASASSKQSSTGGDSIASAFSPASLIARGARQMAPRPKFSAKKPVVTNKQWRSVAILN